MLFQKVGEAEPVAGIAGPEEGEGAVFGDAVEALEEICLMGKEAFFVEGSGESEFFSDAAPGVFFSEGENGIDGDSGEDGEEGGFVDVEEAVAIGEEGLHFFGGNLVFVVDASDLVFQGGFGFFHGGLLCEMFFLYCSIAGEMGDSQHEKKAM